MSIVGGVDIHRKQLTFDWVDERDGRWERGRIAPADRQRLAGWLTRFDGTAEVAFAFEGCTGWRFVAEELARAGVVAHLAEPADTAAARGRKRRAKTDKADAKLLRELLAAGRLPECYIPPTQVLEWRALLELYQDLRGQHTAWAQRIQAVCFHQGTTAPGQAGIVLGDRTRLKNIVDEQLTVSGRLQVSTALDLMDVLAGHLERLRRRLLSTARGVNGARAPMPWPCTDGRRRGCPGVDDLFLRTSTARPNDQVSVQSHPDPAGADGPGIVGIHRRWASAHMRHVPLVSGDGHWLKRIDVRSCRWTQDDQRRG